METNAATWAESVFEAPSGDVKREIDLLLWSFRLQRIRRYLGQPYWDTETQDAQYADRLEHGFRLETVAEHSWCVADSVMLLGWRFPYLNLPHATQLAIVHDKMEIAMGDWNPLGRDGTGNRGHAFNWSRIERKEQAERSAIEEYVSRLEPGNRAKQAALLLEGLECKSPEARFAKCVDKMNALAFIYLKKRGRLDERHVRFLFRFTFSNNRYFPPLTQHSNELLRRNARAFMRQSGSTRRELLSLIQFDQELPLLFDGFDALPTMPSFDVVSGGPPSKRARLGEVFQELDAMPLPRTGIEAQTQLANALNRVEDAHWSEWAPPRFYPPDAKTDRLYPIGPDSIYPVVGWLVDVLVAGKENIFVSAGGAIQVQSKDRLNQRVCAGEHESSNIIYERSDAQGRGVWDPVWKDRT